MLYLFTFTILAFIHLNSILHKNDIINCLPESLQENKIPSAAYSLSHTIRNKIFNYKSTVNNINTNDTSTHGTRYNFMPLY